MTTVACPIKELLTLPIGNVREYAGSFGPALLVTALRTAALYLWGRRLYHNGNFSEGDPVQLFRHCRTIKKQVNRLCPASNRALAGCVRNPVAPFSYNPVRLPVSPHFFGRKSC